MLDMRLETKKLPLDRSYISRLNSNFSFNTLFFLFVNNPRPYGSSLF